MVVLLVICAVDFGGLGMVALVWLCCHVMRCVFGIEVGCLDLVMVVYLLIGFFPVGLFVTCCFDGFGLVCDCYV